MARGAKEAEERKDVKKSKVGIKEIEKVITINLRKDLLKSPCWRRKKKAVSILRKILMKRTKASVIISRELNEKLWSTMKVRIKLVKDGDVIRAELMK